jgi:hypothetical protein
VILKPQAYEGDVATPQEAPEDEPMLSRRLRRAEACSPEGSDPEVACRPDGSGACREAGKAVSETSDRVAVSSIETLESEFCDGACGVCDETMDLALELCTLFRGGSVSSVFKGEGAMTMMFPEWSWHAVAIAPLEMHRRMECRSAGLVVNKPETCGAR